MNRLLSPLVITLLVGPSAPAFPPSADEVARRESQVKELAKVLAAEPTDAGKFALLADVMKEQPDPDFRRKVLDLATRTPGRALDAFLTRLLQTEGDAEVRGRVAAALGRFGSEQCLSALADCARNDPTTEIHMGCIDGRGSARRQATFAIAELAARHPRVAGKAADTLRALPVVVNSKDNKGLADARTQALYQVTRDRALLTPFFERLQSREKADRIDGVNAFRFLNLKAAPAEVVAALKDASPEVVSWAALVLGEIGDPKSGPALMTLAGNPRQDKSARCNAIFALGHMKLAAAADLMERLLDDADPAVPPSAAVALYRITGKRVKQFPEGYNAD